MKNLKFAFSTFLIALFLLTFNTVAQAADNGAGNNGNSGNGNGNSGSGNGNGASLPINKGLVLLLVAGTVLGIKVLKSTPKTAEA